MFCNYLIDIYDNHIQPNLMCDELLYSKLIEYRILLKYDEVVRYESYSRNSYLLYNIFGDKLFHIVDNKLYWNYSHFWNVLGSNEKYNDLNKYIFKCELLNIIKKHYVFSKIFLNDVGW